MKLPKSKATEDFYEWLEKQDLAPYKVMFEDIPEFVQIPFIQKYLREQACTEICIRPARNLNRYFIDIYVHDKWAHKAVNISEFKTHESANRQATIDAFQYLVESENRKS